jgi:hypothetical protein
MARRKRSIQLNPEIGKAVVTQTGYVMGEVIKGGVKVGDRFIQASISSPYMSWAAVTLLCAMGVRAKLWSSDTSNLVTGTGLALLGLTTIEESLPILHGFMGTEAMIDNKWDRSKVVSPWAIEVTDKNDNASWLKELIENV